MQTLLIVVSLPVLNLPLGHLKRCSLLLATLTLTCTANGDPQPGITWKRHGTALPVGRSERTEKALTIRDLRKENAGNYICVATSAGVFDIEAVIDFRLHEPRVSGTGKL